MGRKFDVILSERWPNDVYRRGGVAFEKGTPVTVAEGAALLTEVERDNNARAAQGLLPPFEVRLAEEPEAPPVRVVRKRRKGTN